jgi:hypothetical protein
MPGDIEDSLSRSVEARRDEREASGRAFEASGRIR